MPRNMPPGAYFDDPVANLEPATNERDSHFAMASYGMTRIKEWGRTRRCQAAGFTR